MMIRHQLPSCNRLFALASCEGTSVLHPKRACVRTSVCTVDSRNAMNQLGIRTQTRSQKDHPLLPRAILMVMTCLVAHMTGCGLLSPKPIMLYDGPRGSIILETVPQRGSTAGFRSVTGLQASHPIILESSVIQASLSGLSLGQQRSNTTPGTTNDRQPVIPVLSPDDAQFLAPLISTALSSATADQFVSFRILTSSVNSSSSRGSSADIDAAQSRIGPTAEETAGALYVRSRTLHIILTIYRGRPDPLRAIDSTQAYSKDLAGRTLLFSPASALRTDLSRPVVLPLPADLPSVAVDYQALPRVADPPVSAPVPTAGLSESLPSAAAPTVEEVRELKDLVVRKDLELERMRSEISQLKQELKELTIQQRGSSGSRKQSPRTAPPASGQESTKR